MVNDREDIQFPGGPEYCEQWADSDILGWQGKAEFAVPADKGGVWTGGTYLSLSPQHSLNRLSTMDSDLGLTEQYGVPVSMPSL
jgi:hypothetical protein